MLSLSVFQIKNGSGEEVFLFVFVFFCFLFVFILFYLFLYYVVRYYASYDMAALNSDLPCGIIRTWATKSVLLPLELRVSCLELCIELFKFLLEVIGITCVGPV